MKIRDLQLGLQATIDALHGDAKTAQAGLKAALLAGSNTAAVRGEAAEVNRRLGDAAQALAEFNAEVARKREEALIATIPTIVEGLRAKLDKELVGLDVPAAPQ